MITTAYILTGFVALLHIYSWLTGLLWKTIRRVFMVLPNIKSGEFCGIIFMIHFPPSNTIKLSLVIPDLRR